MPRFQDSTDKDVEQVPPGLYVARLKEIADWESQGGGKYQNDGPQLKWVFEIRSVIDANEVRPTRQVPEPLQPEDFLGKTIWGFTGITMTPRAKARKWAEALMDRTFEEGDAAPEDDELIGRDCKLYVGRTETDRHKVEKLEPYQPPKQRARRAPAIDAEPERELATAGAAARRLAAPADDQDDELDF